MTRRTAKRAVTANSDVDSIKGIVGSLEREAEELSHAILQSKRLLEEYTQDIKSLEKQIFSHEEREKKARSLADDAMKELSRHEEDLQRLRDDSMRWNRKVHALGLFYEKQKKEKGLEFAAILNGYALRNEQLLGDELSRKEAIAVLEEKEERVVRSLQVLTNETKVLAGLVPQVVEKQNELDSLSKELLLRVSVLETLEKSVEEAKSTLAREKVAYDQVVALRIAEEKKIEEGRKQFFENKKEVEEKLSGLRYLQVAVEQSLVRAQKKERELQVRELMSKRPSPSLTEK